MEETPLIRPARDEDCGRLGELKFNYIKQMYSAITPQEILTNTSQERCTERVQELLRNDKLWVDVIEQEGEICGFAAYGPDPDAEGWGLLYDTLYLSQNSMDLHHALLKHMVQQMMTAGLEHIHLWVLRNHYRARYLYEMFGFRTDGKRMEHKAGEMDYCLIRYQYPTL